MQKDVKRPLPDVGPSSRGSINKLSSVLYQTNTDKTTQQIFDEWEQPISWESNDHIELPENIFPEWLDEYIQAVAEETQTPIDAPSFACLAILSAVTNKKFGIKVKGSWTEYLNLYTVLSLNSGNRKSSVFSLFLNPVLKYQNNERKRLRPIIKKETEVIKAKKKALKQIQNEYAKIPSNNLLNDMKDMVAEIDELELNKTVYPKIFTTDATPEKLAIILAEQSEKLALLSAEGAEVFEMIAGRYGEKPNQDLYLKSFSSESVDVERVSRDSLHLESPSMVIGLFVQDSVIQNIPRAFTNRGLTQRFLYSFPQSFLGYREINPDPINKSLLKVYNDNIIELLKFNPPKDKSLSLSTDAVDYLNKQLLLIEDMLKNQNLNEGMIGWLSKLAGNIIRIAGNLHIVNHINNLNDIPLNIDSATLKKAFSLRDYLIYYAQKGFGIMGTDDNVDDLKYLLDVIKSKCVDGQTTYREVFESTKRRFKTASVFREKLDALEELYWIKQYKPNAQSKQFILLNPYVLDL